jgi:signal transduction histidine kinase
MGESIEMAVEEGRLHACVRDLVALSTMPAWWVGRPVTEIALSLHDILVSMLRTEMVTVELDERITWSAQAQPRGPMSASDAVQQASRRETARLYELLDELPAPRQAAFGIGLDGQLGRVRVGASRADFPDELELLLTQVTVNQVAVALQHADLLERHRRAERQLADRAAQQAVVARLGLRALRDTSLDHLLGDVLADVRRAIGADHCDIMELSSDARTLKMRAVDGWPVDRLDVEHDVAPDTVAGRAVLTSNPVIAQDLRADPRFARNVPPHQARVAGSVSVVIHCPRGLFGALSAHTDHPRAFTDDDVHFLQAVANLLAAAIERLRTEDEREDMLARTAAAQAQAEKASSAKSQFLGIMSHELRTPLNAIGGYAQLMEEEIGGPVTAEQRATLERIRRSQRHLLNVIDNVLGFLKLGSGQMHYDIREVAINEILLASEELTRPMMAAKRLRYSRRGTEGNHLVRADGPKLQQILVNLLSNATKFTDADGAVEVECSADASMVHLRVSDTGSGIPPDRLEAVFVPFMQVDERRRRPVEGTGLGLAISRDFAVGMGGQLLAESELGKGSTFTILIPRVP